MADITGPARPYSAPDQLGGAAPRSSEFSTGVTGATPDPGAESLSIASARFNAQVPTRYRPSSLLTPIMQRSGNGMSAEDAARRFADGTPMGAPGSPLSSNGTASNQFEPAAMLRATGQDT